MSTRAGLSACVELFERKQIGLEALPHLTDADLKRLGFQRATFQITCGSEALLGQSESVVQPALSTHCGQSSHRKPPFKKEYRDSRKADVDQKCDYD
jgi:hypothetical protein